MASRQQAVEFLYPKVHRFPFDVVSEMIIQKLHQCNWEIPKAKVTFREHNRERQRFQSVACIEGRDFRIRFDRREYSLQEGRRGEAIHISEISIPGKELHVFEDRSGPLLYLYAGRNWDEDCDGFIRNPKLDSRRNGKPRTYLVYKGICMCRGEKTARLEERLDIRHRHQWEYAPFLMHTTDQGREYGLRVGDKLFFETEAIFEEFRIYLEEVVLTSIGYLMTPINKIAVGM